jgi:dihydroorotase
MDNVFKYIAKNFTLAVLMPMLILHIALRRCGLLYKQNPVELLSKNAECTILTSCLEFDQGYA